MTELHHWGYDFSYTKSVDAMLDALNAAALWQWKMGDSDVYGFYLKCRPKELVEIRIFERAQFRTGDSGGRGGFWAELSSDAESWPKIDRDFRCLLDEINARNITES